MSNKVQFWWEKEEPLAHVWHFVTEVQNSPVSDTDPNLQVTYLEWNFKTCYTSRKLSCLHPSWARLSLACQCCKTNPVIQHCSRDRMALGMHLPGCARRNCSSTAHDSAPTAVPAPSRDGENLSLPPPPTHGEHGKGTALQMDFEKPHEWKKPSGSQDAEQLFTQDCHYKYSFHD